MARGDESIKIQLETDLAAILDAQHALIEVQEWSWTLARRRWRTSDGEELQGYIQRLSSGLEAVHRWMRMLRSMMSAGGIDQLVRDLDQPAKENSDSTE